GRDAALRRFGDGLCPFVEVQHLGMLKNLDPRRLRRAAKPEEIVERVEMPARLIIERAAKAIGDDLRAEILRVPPAILRIDEGALAILLLPVQPVTVARLDGSVKLARLPVAVDVMAADNRTEPRRRLDGEIPELLRRRRADDIGRLAH